MFKTVIGEIAVSRVWIPYTPRCVACDGPRVVSSGQRCRSCYFLFLAERREMNLRRRLTIANRRLERRQSRQRLRESELLPSFRSSASNTNGPRPTTRLARLAQRKRLTRPRRLRRELLFQPFQFWLGSTPSPSKVFKWAFSLDSMLDGRHIDESKLPTSPSPFDIAMEREAVGRIAGRLMNERAISFSEAMRIIEESL